MMIVVMENSEGGLVIGDDDVISAKNNNLIIGKTSRGDSVMTNHLIPSDSTLKVGINLVTDLVTTVIAMIHTIQIEHLEEHVNFNSCNFISFFPIIYESKT